MLTVKCICWTVRHRLNLQPPHLPRTCICAHSPIPLTNPTWPLCGVWQKWLFASWNLLPSWFLWGVLFPDSPLSSLAAQTQSSASPCHADALHILSWALFYSCHESLHLHPWLHVASLLISLSCLPEHQNRVPLHPLKTTCRQIECTSSWVFKLSQELSLCPLTWGSPIIYLGPTPHQGPGLASFSPLVSFRFIHPWHLHCSSLTASLIACLWTLTIVFRQGLSPLDSASTTFSTVIKAVILRSKLHVPFLTLLGSSAPGNKAWVCHNVINDICHNVIYLVEGE